MSVYFPEGVSSLGRDGWWWVPSVIADAAMTMAEIAHASVIQVNMAMRPGFGADAEVSKVDDRRLGAQKTYEAFGVTKDTLGTVTWIDRPQDAAAAATAKHRDSIADASAGHLVNRRGLGSAPENIAAWAATQRYNLYPVVAGPQIPIASADEGGQFEYKQDFIVTGPVVKGTLVA